MSPALRLDILPGDASEIRNMGDTVHHHKCSCGDKSKQRCFKSHDSSMTYETTVKTVIPWPSQCGKCLTRRMFTFLTLSRSHIC